MSQTGQRLQRKALIISEIKNHREIPGGLAVGWRKGSIDEIHDLKDFIDQLQVYIIGQEYMSGWFDCLEKNGDLTEYEQDGVLADHQMPFSYDSMDKLYTLGITRPMLVKFAKDKYQEWKTSEEKEGEEIEEA